MQIQPASPVVGAVITDVDLREPLQPAERDQLVRALGDTGVLFFRDQDLTPEQHIAFALQFGAIDINRFFTPVDGYPMIAEVRKDPEQKSNIGGGWHTDHSYDIAPALGSVLYAREVPPMGGDTVFASMYAAFDSLSDGMKQTLEGLNALHSSKHVFGADRTRDWGDLQGRLQNTGAATQDAIHPVVIAHPISGRKLLYVNPDFTVKIDGWNVAESKALLDYLYAHAARPENQHRFQWAPGSIALWDNRATWHYALNDYQGARRLMHRITIAGVPLQRAPLATQSV
ncbi:MAG: TauD/TfdA family dioxygenase [Burkholderiales bacterium]|nr:MAG: TauD/TfdA family dioxygenase [Burkholderiales bacterium]